MKRRNFLINISKAVATQVAVGGLHFQVRASQFVWMAWKSAAQNNRILVIIQLSGGNDGLNMLPPLNQMSKYLSLRPNIGLAENTILPLGTTGAGFHPAMTGLKSLYDDKQLLVVQGLSYPNQSFSHFAATKIWNVGINDTQEQTGWIGRYLNYDYPTYPDDTFTDPIALQVEDLPSTLFNSNAGILSTNYGLNTLNGILTNPLSSGLTSIGGSVGSGIYGDYLAFVREQMLLSDQFASKIKQAGTAGTNAYTNYPNTTLANKLKVIAKLIRGGLNTKVYHVSLGGFDTHNDQLGRQNSLLTELSGAITAFQKDLVAMGGGIADRVTGMTFSEFGRRAQENASRGTDHGTIVPMLVFGTQLNPNQMIGNSPDLNNLTGNNLPTQFDYRRAYAAFLTDWLGTSEADKDTLLLQNQQSILPNAASTTFGALPIFKQSCVEICVPAQTKIIRN